MAFGLKNKAKEIVTELNRLRKDATRPRDISLRQYLAENFKDDGNPATPAILMSEIGVDPNVTQVHQLMSSEDGQYLACEVVREGVRRGMGQAQRELMQRAREHNIASLGPVTSDGGSQRFMQPEVFLDPVNSGIVQGTFYPDLIIREEVIGTDKVTIPKLNLSDAAVKETGEAATLEEGMVSYGSKDVKIKTWGREIKVTDEAIKFNTINMVQLFFQDLGRLLGHKLNGLAIDAIINDNAVSGAEAAAVIGVEDTDAGITWKDLARVAVQGGLIGRVFSQAIGNATTALDYLDMDEMKRLYFGNPMLPTQIRTPITLPESLYVSAAVPASQLILNDPSVSLLQLTAQPLTVETDRIISKRMTEVAASIITGFAKLQRTGSIIIDGSIAYSGNQFPSWFAPTA